MLKEIKSIGDVEAFAKQLIDEGLSFHPDDEFNDYISLKDNKRSYTAEEAESRNELMRQCFDICENEGVDIYDLMLETTLTETGMDKYIPLPSESNVRSI